ncbi:MAG: tetratricopeptide (TPR) repeat protein [Myxococcota bacterium]|jgi:tetratricopeptide (TPR) repeat protein
MVALAFSPAKQVWQAASDGVTLNTLQTTTTKAPMLPWPFCAALTAPGDDLQERRYHLSASLLEQGLTASAEALLLEVVRAGPEEPLFPYALAKLADISELTGDSVELRRIVGAMEPADFPPTARSILHYHHRARDLYRRGELTFAREAIEEVTPGSPEHPRALLLDGSIAVEQHKYRTAVRSFVYAVHNEGADEELRAHAVLNIARVYYGLARYSDAENYYSMVSRDSAVWPTALVERAWARFMTDEPATARGGLITLASPHFTADSATTTGLSSVR